MEEVEAKHTKKGKEPEKKKKFEPKVFCGNFIIYPHHRPKAYWDIFITFVLLVTCIVTPYDIAF